MDPLDYEPKRKSVWVALLLWFFLGWLGAHRFYFGKTNTAIGLFSLWALSRFIGFAKTFFPPAAAPEATLPIYILGFTSSAIFLIWLLVDLFLIFGWVRQYNIALAQQP